MKARLDNLEIIYNIDKNIVRGLDYYTKTVFEFASCNAGTQGTICGGGRYDGLVELCGGKPTPGVGFALGVERLLMEIESQDVLIPQPRGVEIYFAAVGGNAVNFTEKLVYMLRKRGISAECDLTGRSLKAQMKHADRLGATYAVVLGNREIESNRCVMKNMKTGEQKDISLDSVMDRMLTGKMC